MIGLCMFEQWNTRFIRIIHEHVVKAVLYVMIYLVGACLFEAFKCMLRFPCAFVQLGQL